MTKLHALIRKGDAVVAETHPFPDDDAATDKANELLRDEYVIALVFVDERDSLEDVIAGLRTHVR